MPSNLLVVSLLRDSAVVSWRALGKDGADLPPAQATLRSAQQRMGAGETYDFEFAPRAAGDVRLQLQVQRGPPQAPFLLSVPIRVRGT